MRLGSRETRVALEREIRAVDTRGSVLEEFRDRRFVVFRSDDFSLPVSTFSIPLPQSDQSLREERTSPDRAE